MREEPRRCCRRLTESASVEFAIARNAAASAGLFSVKFPHISGAMLDDKMTRIRESGAERWCRTIADA